MSVATYTEADIQAINNEANDKIKDLTQTMQIKYERLELELAETKAHNIRLQQEHRKYAHYTIWSRKKRRNKGVSKLRNVLQSCSRGTTSRKKATTRSKQNTTSWLLTPGWVSFWKNCSHSWKEKINEANVEIAKVKKKHERQEVALKAKNGLLEKKVETLKKEYHNQREELSAKENILEELVSQLTKVECWFIEL